MNAMIEKLKKNEKPFMLLSPDEQDLLDGVGWKNRIVLGPSGWKDDCDKIRGRERIHLTYAIKPDYQPEPDTCQYCGACRMVRPSGKWQYNCHCYDPDRRPEKTVDLEIENFDGWLGVKTDDRIPFIHLHCLPSMPSFQGFFVGSMKLRFDEVSTHMEGKPYARFRK